MTVQALAAIPAAPLLLPEVSPAQPAEVADAVADLRSAVDVALAAIPPVDTIVLLAAGPEGLVHDASRASLGSYGYPEVRADLAHDDELLGAVAARGQTPRVRDDRLDGDLAVLALLVSAAHPGTCVLPVTVPVGAKAEHLGATATGISAAAQATGRAVAIVAAGDLAATLDTSSPGYLVEGAEAWDRQAVAAVNDADLDRLAELGPAEAERVQARGWAPLVVLLTIARGRDLGFDAVTYLAPRGVGQLVAH